MSGAIAVSLSGEEFHLLPERAAYWPGRNTLILSDIHAGKAAHFRKAGLPLPSRAGQADLERLGMLIERYCAAHVIITGDLFHSDLNSEVTAFAEWRQQYSLVNMTLVLGNHDRYRREVYEGMALAAVEQYTDDRFLFCHHPPEAADDHFCFSGHLHPGVALRGRGHERMAFPCFYIQRHCMILPAFSLLTGLALLPPENAEQVYMVVAERNVVKW